VRRGSMRIAFVYDAVYPYVLGGGEKRVWEIARRMVARGHEVHVFGMQFWEGEQTITKESVIFHGVCKPFSFYRKGKRRILPAFIFGFLVFLALAREKFDIVDCQQFPYTSVFGSAAACRISKSPLVITWYEVWGDYWYEYLGRRGAAGIVIERLAARIHAHSAAISNTTKAGLTILARDREITVLPIGIDIAEIDAIPASECTSDIIFVGRLIREKHVDILIDAVAILKEDHPGIQCLIIGGGPERSDLENKVKEQGLSGSVTFTGFFNDSREVIARMKSSRVFVLPSTREGFGIAALEALATGLPIVTVDHPKNASSMFAREGCGVLTSLDAGDMAEKVRVLLGSDIDRNQIRRKASGFDWGPITEKIEGYYSRVVDSVS